MRFSAQNFPNNKLGEVRFYGSDIPRLKMLAVNGAAPYNWNPEKTNYTVQLKNVDDVKYYSVAARSSFTTSITEPESYPGTAVFSVSDASGATTQYRVQVIATRDFMADFEKALSGSVDGVFIGNQNVEWDIEGRFGTNMGTGKCIYFYPTQRGLETMPIPGGLSEISFDAENLTQSGGRNICVSVNDVVIIDSVFEANDVYRVKKNNLQILGDAVIKIENITEGTKKLGIDNINWSGYAPDRNAYLESIKINGQKITGFNRNVFSYVVPWNENLTGNDITTKPESDKARVEVFVQESYPPTYFFKVVAANGAWSKYRLAFKQNSKNKNVTETCPVVYPNPTRNKVNVKNYGQVTGVKVFNSLGQQVKLLRGQVTEVDFSGMPKGVFVLEISTQNNGVLYTKVNVCDL